MAYNALKAGCERAVEENFPERALIINPGIITGPGEDVGRLPWWLETIARGGRVLAPGAPDRLMQLIDARDIARFVLDQLAAQGSGRYVTSGVPGNTTMGDLLRDCVRVTGADTELVWADEPFLREMDVAPWTELPLWAPDIPEVAGTWQASSRKALAAGLRCRPVSETVADTWRALRSGEYPAPKRPDPTSTRSAAHDAGSPGNPAGSWPIPICLTCGNPRFSHCPQPPRPGRRCAHALCRVVHRMALTSVGTRAPCVASTPNATVRAPHGGTDRVL